MTTLKVNFSEGDILTAGTRTSFISAMNTHLLLI